MFYVKKKRGPDFACDARSRGEAYQGIALFGAYWPIYRTKTLIQKMTIQITKVEVPRAPAQAIAPQKSSYFGLIIPPSLA